jgi:hypothetical protein
MDIRFKVKLIVKYLVSHSVWNIKIVWLMSHFSN